MDAEQAPSPPEIALFAGGELTAASKGLVRRGARLSATYLPDDRWRSGLWLAGYPNLGLADLTPTLRDLVSREIAAPYLSRILAKGDLSLDYSPLAAPDGQSALWISATVGLTYTRDDDTWLSPDYRAPLGEWSPSFGLGLAVDRWGKRAGIQLRAAISAHEERGPWGDPVWFMPLWVGIDLGIRAPVRFHTQDNPPLPG